MRLISLLLGLLLIASAGAKAASLTLEGTPIQGGIMYGRVDPGCVVEFDAMLVRVAEDGGFVIGFRHDNPPWAVLRTQCPDGSRRRQFLPVEQREYQEQHIDGLPPKMVTPDEETLARIKAEAERVRKSVISTVYKTRPLRLGKIALKATALQTKAPSALPSSTILPPVASQITISSWP